MLDNKGYGRPILMDLRKVFHAINLDLLITKLHVYGFSMESLKLIKSYLNDRWQRTKLNTGFSKSNEILLGVPLGSVLGPLFLISILKMYYPKLKTVMLATMHNLIFRLELDSVLAI